MIHEQYWQWALIPHRRAGTTTLVHGRVILTSAFDSLRQENRRAHIADLSRGDHTIGPREGNPHERIFTRYGKRTGFHFSTCELFGRSFTDDSRAVLSLIVALRVCLYVYICQLLDLISSDGRPYGGTDPDFLWELVSGCEPRWATVI